MTVSMTMGVREAERFIPGRDDVCISIRTPGAEPAELCGGWRAVLRMFINDLPENQPRLVPGDITPAQADEIVQFVRAYRDAKRLVIHCDAGVSRSVSVARALDATWLNAPNMVIFDAVRAAMRRAQR